MEFDNISSLLNLFKSSVAEFKYNLARNTHLNWKGESDEIHANQDIQVRMYIFIFMKLVRKLIFLLPNLQHIYHQNCLEIIFLILKPYLTKKNCSISLTKTK